MATYIFPKFKEPIISDSYTPIFVGVHYIEGVSQPGFIAHIRLNCEDGRERGVMVLSETDRPESPINLETAGAWIDANLIKYEQ